jgi:hypothetical protein
MRIKEVKLYNYAELSEDAKEKALNECRYINVDYGWWEYIYEDANEIGAKIDGFDMDKRFINLKLTKRFELVIGLILKNHGKDCETYKLAMEYQKKLKEETDKAKEEFGEGYTYEEIAEEVEDEFVHALGEEYLSLLTRDQDYLTSDDAVEDMILANEYEFLEDGTIA